MGCPPAETRRGQRELTSEQITGNNQTNNESRFVHQDVTKLKMSPVKQTTHFDNGRGSQGQLDEAMHSQHSHEKTMGCHLIMKY